MKRASRKVAFRQKLSLLQAFREFLRDPKVGKLDKIIATAWPLYVVSPIDVAPEGVASLLVMVMPFLAPFAPALATVTLSDDILVLVRGLYLLRVIIKYYQEGRRPS